MFLSISDYEGRSRQYQFENIYQGVDYVERRGSASVIDNFLLGIEATVVPVWDYEMFDVIHKCIEQNTNYCIKVGILVISRPTLVDHRIYNIFMRNTY